MIISQDDGAIGSAVTDFDLATATDEDFASLRKLVYNARIAVLKDQDLAPAEFVELGHRMGTVVTYYEPMYHHPEFPEIFVSSNVPVDGQQVGVPQTGKFWHADYQFRSDPFAITMVYPQVIPEHNRGTYFIDMARAWRGLPPSLQAAAAGTTCLHTGRRYFKIRPSDVYRPIGELITEVEREHPPAAHPTVFRHPATGEDVLYMSEGFADYLVSPSGERLDDSVVRDLLRESGQLDMTFTHPNIHLQTFVKGDLLIWDNRVLVHRALHAAKAEPAASFRVTVQDEHPFYETLTR